MIQLFKMAFRNLGRNRRRSLLSALAVSVGLGLLILMASVVAGEMRGALENTIRLDSGHLQIRAASYDEQKLTLDWKDLVADPQAVVQQLRALPQVSDATPRLFASGIITRGEQSRGVEVIGIDPGSSANQPFRAGLLAGTFLTADDRQGVLIGNVLADKLKMNVGDQINLLVNTASGSVDQQQFTIRGIYTTNTASFDESTVFMPLVKAQAFTGTQGHASAILIFLHDRDQAQAVASAIQAPGYQVLTWQGMNELIFQFEGYANSYMVILYIIVLGITATVVTNTLIMAVFERTREIGILAAIGMKARRILMQFLTEAGLIATGGVVGGIVLGIGACLLFNRSGFYIGNYGISGMLMADTIYAYLTPQNVVRLSIITYAITLFASLYPATMAARLEPVEALHAQ